MAHPHGHTPNNTIAFRLRALHDATREIGLLDSEQAIAEAAVRHAAQALTASTAAVFLRSTASSQDYLPAAWLGSGADAPPPIAGAHIDVHCIVASGHAMNYESLHGSPGCADYYRPYVFAPLDAAGHVLGLLGVRRTGAPLTDLEAEFFCGLAAVTAVAIAQVRSRRDAVAAEGRRALLARYFSPQVAAHLLADNPGGLGTAVRCDATILFSDIRGFTTLSESMDAARVLAFLNAYFAVMTNTVFAHGGTVDKLIGDGLLAVFGAPAPVPGHALAALRCARDMLAAVSRLDLSGQGLPRLRTGIGIHSGPVIAGNLGGAQFLEFTVLGATVNLASRIEGMTKDLGADALASETTIRLAGDAVASQALPPVPVRGIAQPVRLFRILAIDGAPFDPSE